MIPFTGQSLRTNSSSIAKKPTPPQNKRYPGAEKIEPKVLSNTTGQIETQHISIKQILTKSKEKKESENIDYSNRPATPFTIDDVKMVWKQLAFKMKDEGLETVYLAISKRDPVIDAPNSIQQEFANQIQIDILQNHLSDVIEFIREKLNNWSVEVKFVVSQQEDDDKRLLTGKDKFEELAKKNSNLYSLQKTFNLDVEY